MTPEEKTILELVFSALRTDRHHGEFLVVMPDGEERCLECNKSQCLHDDHVILFYNDYEEEGDTRHYFKVSVEKVAEEKPKNGTFSFLPPYWKNK